MLRGSYPVLNGFECCAPVLRLQLKLGKFKLAIVFADYVEISDIVSDTYSIRKSLCTALSLISYFGFAYVFVYSVVIIVVEGCVIRLLIVRSMGFD